MQPVGTACRRAKGLHAARRISGPVSGYCRSLRRPFQSMGAVLLKLQILSTLLTQRGALCSFDLPCDATLRSNQDLAAAGARLGDISFVARGNLTMPNMNPAFLSVCLFLLRREACPAAGDTSVADEAAVRRGRACGQRVGDWVVCHVRERRGRSTPTWAPHRIPTLFVRNRPRPRLVVETFLSKTQSIFPMTTFRLFAYE